MTGNYNIAYGYTALSNNTAGSLNAAYGPSTLAHNTTGAANTAIGVGSLQNNTTGSFNTANGNGALTFNTTGSGNVAIGDITLWNTTGNNNIALGSQAGGNLTTGDNNIDIGNSGVAAESNTIRIGTAGIQTNVYIAGISGVTVPNTANPVIIDSISGQLGTVDMSTLVGPTGAAGSQGPVGPVGPQGPAGVNGSNGVGFVAGAYLYLPISTAAPVGFTKIGTKTDYITDLHGRIKILKMNVYQKN